MAYEHFEVGAVVASGKLKFAARDRQLLDASLTQFGDGYVTLTVERGKKQTRSQRANRYYWGQVLTPMSKEGSAGDQSPEEIHDAMCTMFLPDEKKRVEFFNRTTGETLDVEVDTRRSSKLTGDDFYLFVEKVRKFALEFMGVRTENPDPRYWRRKVAA